MTRQRPGTPSLTMQLDVLFGRRLVICAICGEVIERREDCEWDHTFEHADGGPHIADNLRPLHSKASGGCHKRKSSKSETQRSRIDRLEKARRAMDAVINRTAAPEPAADPGARCHRCGEYQTDCTCHPKERRRNKWPASTACS